MTYRQIEQSREVRLWITTIIVPVVSLAATTMAIPEVRQAVAAKAKSVKESIQAKRKNSSEKKKFKIVKD